METFGERLKYAIEYKGFTNNKVAVNIGIHASTIKNYINNIGKPDGIKLDKVCEFLSINRYWLETGTGEIDTNKGVKNIEVSFLNAETSSIMHVPLVTQYAYGGYLGGFADNEFVENLPKVPFILDKEYKGQYLCFEVKGDSMECENEESIPEGSILLSRNVQKDYWKSKLHINKWDFVIVHQTKGILVKRIINHDVENGIITIHSLNDFYQDQELHLKDISQIFNIVEVQQKRKRR